MTDFIIILILLLIVGGAGAYVYRAKRSGKKCIGCPEAARCSGHCAGCSGGCGNKAE